MTVTSSNYDRRENELYETEAWATEALLRYYPVTGLDVWEPAAGNHKMADVLREAGALVITSDIATYSRQHTFPEWDFYRGVPNVPLDVSIAANIITNPPYGKGNREAVRFCELALERSPGMVAMLLTAKFDFGKTRLHLFRDNTRFRAKINLVDRISWAGNGETGTEDHAWYVWGPETSQRRPPIILYAGKAA